MNKEEVNKYYAKILTDLDFERLDLIMKKANIFSALNIAHYEIRHSNFLAWLLDPNGNHGLSNFFLKRLIIRLFEDDRALNVHTINIPKLLKSPIFVYREWHNIDILIEFEDTVIAIENKINSSEHSNQLKRYFKLVEDFFPDKKRVLCYLTPLGNQSSMSDNYIELGYQQIVSDLQDILHLYENALNNKVKTYIEDYIETLKMNVLEDSSANELAKEIYKNHRDLLEFIFEHRPDSASEYLIHITKYIVKKGYVLGSPNKGYIRFLTSSLHKLLPPYPKNYGGYTYKEPLLFEIDFYWNKGRIIFKVVVPPADHELKNVLCELIESLPEAKKPSGKKWTTYFNTKDNFVLEEALINSDIAIEADIEKFFQKIEKHIAAVENVLMANQDRISNEINY